MLQKIDENIWIKQTPLSLLGVTTSSTMTLIRIAGNRLVVISPVKVDLEMVNEINAIGEVIAVISPNGFHHLFFHHFLQHFPKAHFYFSSALQDKVEQRLKYCEQYSVLSDIKEMPWSAELKTILIDGMPKVNEYVFYHRKTKTLIVSDLLFFIRQAHTLWTRIAWRLVGIIPDVPSQSLFFRFNIKNKKAYQSSLLEIRELDISRIIVAHDGILYGDDLVKAKKIMFEGITASIKN